MSDTPEPLRPASAGAALVAAASPPVAWLAFLLGAVAIAKPREAAHFLQEGGLASYLVLFAGAAAAFAGAGGLYFVSRGNRVPVAVFGAIGAIPWVAGVGGTLYSVRMVEEALAAVNPADKAIIAAAGTSEALSIRLLGAWSAAALLAGVAVGLGALAFARPSRAQEASPLGSLFAAAAALPMLGLAVMSMGSLGLAVAPAGAAALGAALACGLAGAALRQEEPDELTRLPLAAAAAACGGFGFVAACAVVVPGLERDALGMLAYVEPELKRALLGSAMGSAPAALALQKLGPIFALAPLAAVAIWGVTRGAGGVRAPLRVVALVLVVAAVVAIDLAGGRRLFDMVQRTAAPSWGALVQFEPLTLEGGVGRQPVDAFVTTGQVVLSGRRGEATLGPDARPDLARLFAGALALGSEGRAPARGTFEQSVHPTLVLAVDARVKGLVLRMVLEAAQDAGYHSVAFAGEDPLGRQLRRIEPKLPLLSALALETSSAKALFAPALPAEVADADPVLWHGLLGADGPVEIRPRAGSTESPMRFERRTEGGFASEAARFRAPTVRADQPVYLAVQANAAPVALASLVGAIGGRGHLPVIVYGAIPGHPELVFDPAADEPLEDGPAE